MSEREWIDRVRSSRPEDYSPGDLGKLRDQARQSPEVRRALAEEIRLDQALHAAAGRSPLSTARIVAHITGATAASAAAGGSLISTVASWSAVLVLTAAAALVGVAVVPDPGAGSKGDVPSPGYGKLLEPSVVESIDPVEDPLYVDDGTSPSDRLPSTESAAIAGKLPERSSPSEKSTAAKTAGSKGAHAADDSPRPPSAVTTN